MTTSEFAYEHTRRIIYGDDDDGAQFVPVCPICGRFVKADDTIAVNADGAWIEGPNATCSVHGRVVMPFEGYAP